jgi:HEAT repeat protein
MEKLTSPDYQERNQADSALRNLGPEAIPVLCRVLRVSDDRGWPSLRTLLAKGMASSFRTDLAARRREAAASLLARLGPRAVAAAPDLVERLADKDQGVIRSAEKALACIGPACLPELVVALKDSRPAIRGRAAELLSNKEAFGRAVFSTVGALVRTLDDPEAQVRAQAATVLGRLGDDRQPILRGLEQRLADPVESVRVAALRALGELGPRAQSVSVALAGRLQDSSPQVQVEAARALWRIDHQSQEIVPVFIQGLKNQAVHWQAALALGEVGPAAREAVPALLEALQTEIAHRPSRTPQSAALALSRMGPTAVPGLVALLDHEQAPVRVGAALALAGQGTNAAPAAARLAEMLRDPDPEARMVAVLALGAIGPAARTARAKLAQLMNEGDEYLRAAVVATINRLGDPEPALPLQPRTGAN